MNPCHFGGEINEIVAIIILLRDFERTRYMYVVAKTSLQNMGDLVFLESQNDLAIDIQDLVLG